MSTYTKKAVFGWVNFSVPRFPPRFPGGSTFRFPGSPFRFPDSPPGQVQVYLDFPFDSPIPPRVILSIPRFPFDSPSDSPIPPRVNFSIPRFPLSIPRFSGGSTFRFPDSPCRFPGFRVGQLFDSPVPLVDLPVCHVNCLLLS